mmetsp:Transcript_59542/g.174168  ORF Transcript_59542/g.174168 Transcript_59542/m.174168 type:complete len:117 (+) Transcript_59542:134-484(+)
MGDEVKLKLIFANDNASQDITIPASTVVKDVKKNIMENYWPTTLASIESVERLRLFAGGKELGGKDLDDQKSLKDVKLVVSAGYPTPVHVQPVLKAANAPADRDVPKPSQCFCSLL